jgi:uncharacterized protein YndB with AHSA1/START domain
MWTRAHSVEVRGTPDEVFAYLADFSRHHEWSPTPLRIEAETEGPVRAGSRFRGVGQTRGADIESTVEVTEVDAPRRLAFVATSPSTTFRHELSLTPSGAGTRVERRMTLLKAKPVLRLIWPIVGGRVIWPQAVAAMERLREVRSRS